MAAELFQVRQHLNGCALVARLRFGGRQHHRALEIVGQFLHLRVLGDCSGQIPLELKRYAKTIYLTQTVEKKDGKLNRFLNLEDAFKAWESDPGPREWRTHFHVPVFLDDLGEFGTTRFAIEDALKFHKQKPLSRQLEIETYTWDVLPDHLKTGDIVDYVCRELEWVRGQLQ